MKTPSTPNLDKLLDVDTKESNCIGAFLDWLTREKHMYICEEQELFYDEVKACPHCGADPSDWAEDTMYSFCPSYRGDDGINRLLAEYYDIDHDGVDKERKALLEYIRENQ